MPVDLVHAGGEDVLYMGRSFLVTFLIVAFPGILGAQNLNPWSDAFGEERPLPPKPTRGKDRWWTSPAGLKYRISFPRPGKRRPGLILLLHGSSGRYQGVEQEFARPCLKAGFVVVIPRSTRCEEPSAPNQKWTEVDYPKLESLTREIAHRAAVDHGRIYMLGFSNGNRGGNVVFTRPELYAGFVALGGGPWDIGRSRTLTERECKETGIYFIVGSNDPYKNEAERGHLLAKQAGVEDIVYTEVSGMGHTMPAGCWKDVVPWLLRKRRPYTAGECLDVNWTEKASGLPKWRLIYGFSTERSDIDACQAIEWGWLADSWMRTLALRMECIKEEVGAKAAKYHLREPAVLIISPQGKERLRVKGSRLLSIWKKARRLKDPLPVQRALRKFLVKKVESAVRAQ